MKHTPRFYLLIPLLCLLSCLPTAGAGAQATMTVDAGKVANRINPGMYGQFVEIMFGGVEGSLWQELLRNRSFEEPPNEIGLSRSWNREPDDRDHDPAIHFSWDANESYPPNHAQDVAGHSMGIDITRNQWNIQQRRGISQSGIATRKGVPYHGSVWLKGAPFEGAVVVALEQDRTDGGAYASAQIDVKGEGWARYEFTLTPTVTDPLAKFSMLVHGLGSLRIDQVSLMPGDAVAGTPAGVAEKIKGLKPAFVRWPGGNVAQDYHWMRGVGPRDQRPTWVNKAWWNEVETSDFGTDEFLAFCKAMGTEPSITVNVEGSGATAEEAAHWVEYANGPVTSKFGKLRAQNGHPEPYGVKYWEVGNEVFGNWEIGHTDAATYARNFNRYAAAMKAVDPAIKLIAVGDEPEWNRTVVEAAGRQIDLLAIHRYYGEKEMHGDLNNLLAHPLTLEKFYAETRDMLHKLAPDGHIQLTVNEWNTALTLPAQNSMKSAIYAGGMLNGFERNGDLIGSNAVSDLVNGWSAGIIQVSRLDLFVTPTYLVDKLYNDHLGTERLAASVTGPTFNTTLQGNNIPVLDAIAERSADGSKIYIKAVNRDLQHPLTLDLKVSGASVGGQAVMDSVTAATPDVANTLTHPANVAVQHRMLAASGSFQVQLPADSVSVLTLEAGRNP